ncbi:hypothetical protein EDC30_1051, partial [Paucimonas lemoignei]
MRALIVVVSQPFIQIDLQLFNRSVNLAPERNLVKLLQDRLVEALANAVGLRMVGLGFGVLDLLPDLVRNGHGVCGNKTICKLVWCQVAERA